MLPHLNPRLSGLSANFALIHHEYRLSHPFVSATIAENPNLAKANPATIHRDNQKYPNTRCRVLSDVAISLIDAENESPSEFRSRRGWIDTIAAEFEKDR